jgi:hypothetical protein
MGQYPYSRACNKHRRNAPGAPLFFRTADVGFRIRRSPAYSTPKASFGVIRTAAIPIHLLLQHASLTLRKGGVGFHGAAVTFTRMKRGGDVAVGKLSRTFKVVALLMSTVVVAALNESGCPGSNVPALCAS